MNHASICIQMTSKKYLTLGTLPKSNPKKLEKPCQIIYPPTHNYSIIFIHQNTSLEQL